MPHAFITICTPEGVFDYHRTQENASAFDEVVDMAASLLVEREGS